MKTKKGLNRPKNHKNLKKDSRKLKKVENK